MWPEMPSRRIERQAQWAGAAAGAAVIVAIYGAYELLKSVLDEEWAVLLLILPASFALMVYEPVHWRAKHWLTVRYCTRHGGHTYVPNTQINSLRTCARCGDVDLEHWRSSRN